MRLLIADKFPERFLADFAALGLDIDYAPECGAEGLASRAKEAGILVVRSTKVSRAAIEGASRLALIIRAGAGYDTIDVAAASERGIFVTNCPGKNSVAVAELTMGLLIAADRRIPQGTAELRAGKWNKKEYGKAEGLKGKTLGICGFGPIGHAVAKRAAAFEMNVVVWSRSMTKARAEEHDVGFAPTLFDLAERSDAVSVHLAQTAETRRLFNADFFARLKPGAIFVNTARGGLHDQKALLDAMKTKGVRAALDVFDPEPAGGEAEFRDELLEMPGFVGTHHIGASTEQAQDAIAEESVRICRDFVTRGQVPNAVNIEQHSPAMVELVVRHYDKVGVLASVLGIIRQYGVNIEEMSNTIFQGAKAAVAIIRLGSWPSDALVQEIEALRDQIIQVEAKRVGPG